MSGKKIWLTGVTRKSNTCGARIRGQAGEHEFTLGPREPQYLETQRLVPRGKRFAVEPATANELLDEIMSAVLEVLLALSLDSDLRRGRAWFLRRTDCAGRLIAGVRRWRIRFRQNRQQTCDNRNCRLAYN